MERQLLIYHTVRSVWLCEKLFRKYFCQITWSYGAFDFLKRQCISNSIFQSSSWTNFFHLFTSQAKPTEAKPSSSLRSKEVGLWLILLFRRRSIHGTGSGVSRPWDKRGGGWVKVKWPIRTDLFPVSFQGYPPALNSPVPILYTRV